MADIVFLTLLFIHIAAIVLWMGGTVIFVSVLSPSMRKLTPSGAADLYKAIGPAFTRYVGVSATLAIVVGLVLYAYINGYIVSVSSSLATSSSGMPWILIGIIFGLAAYVVGIGIVLRANRKMLSMMNQAPAGTGGPSPEMQKLQRRITISSRVQAILLVAALLTMVLGANM